MPMRVFAIALVLFAAAFARAGDLPSAGSITDPATGESHGWSVSPSRSGSVSIQHFPPRAADALGRAGAEDGTVRLAASLAQMPEAMAAWGNRLFMVFPPAAGGKGSLRRILALDAERGSVDGTWVGDPGGGRLPSLAGLPGDRTLLGVAGTPAGPVAFLSGEADELLLLREGAWSPMGLPTEWPRQRPASLRLVSLSDGAALVAMSSPAPGAWIAAIPARPSAEQLASPSWRWVSLDIPPTEPEAEGAGIFSIRGRFILERRIGETLEVWDIGPGQSARRLAQVANVPPGYATAPLDQTGRLALVWRSRSDTPAAPGTSPAEILRIAEVSTQTGQILYQGPAKAQPPFSGFELKILAIFLVLVMLAIVVFVLRPERTAAPLSLPRGVSLAEPGRRMLAGLLDAGLAFLFATKLTGIGAGEVVSIRALTGQVDALTLYLSTVGLGLGIGTLTEWLLGRSVGKALTGIEVGRPVVRRFDDGRLEPAIARVSLLGALTRNIVKWVLPPVAMSGLSSPDQRHRGDVAGRTVVIVRDESDRA